MKLELRYIAPYLPYELKVLNQVSNEIYNCYGAFETGQGLMVIINKDLDTRTFGLSDIKPILRPMSDFWDTSKSWMQQVRDIDNSIEFWSGEFDNPCHLPYVCFELLVKNHFDVFGLIEKCLAIDINTLNT